MPKFQGRVNSNAIIQIIVETADKVISREAQMLVRIQCYAVLRMRPLSWSYAENLSVTWSILFVDE
jgi:hypothetical protein